MLDPIGGFDRIQDFFRSYVETSFRISDPAVASARRELLERPDVFATLPFVEPVPRYRSSEHRLEDLIDMTDGPLEPLSREARVAFVELALSGLFEGTAAEGEVRRMSGYAPYQHQVEMLTRGVRPATPASSRRVRVQARPRASCSPSSPPWRTRPSAGADPRPATSVPTGGGPSDPGGHRSGKERAGLPPSGR
jgi:hypothetical protein